MYILHLALKITIRPINLKFNGTIFRVASSRHPRKDPSLADTPYTHDLLRIALGKCHEDATEKTAFVEFQLYAAVR